jgi:hypothetical protein
MRLFTLEHFRKEIYAEECAPAISTLRARNKLGRIAGGIIDECGRHYVDMDEYNRKHQIVRGLLEKREQLAASPELAGLL